MEIELITVKNPDEKAAVVDHFRKIRSGPKHTKLLDTYKNVRVVWYPEFKAYALNLYQDFDTLQAGFIVYSFYSTVSHRLVKNNRIKSIW